MINSSIGGCLTYLDFAKCVMLCSSLSRKSVITVCI